MTDTTMTPTPLLTAQGVTVCDKFSTDLADLCNTASQAGMTPNMIWGQFVAMALMMSFGLKDVIDALPSEPVAPTALDTPLPAGSIVTLTLGAITIPTVDTEMLAFMLIPEGGLTPYSVELRYLVSNSAATYTADTLWPGVTIYGKTGDLIRWTLGESAVSADISQDGGANWTHFYTYPRSESTSLQAHVTSSAYVTGYAAVLS